MKQVYFNPFGSKLDIREKASGGSWSVSSKDDSYSLTSSDIKKIIVFSIDATEILTVPPDSSGIPNGAVFKILKRGNGLLFIRGASGVTIDAFENNKGIEANEGYALLQKVASDRYNLSGDLISVEEYGYFNGGNSGGYVDTCDRLTFSTGVTSANTVSDLSQARDYLSGVSDTSMYGYFAGGLTGGSVITVDRIVFKTGATNANTTSNLSESRYALTGVSDGSSYGYFAGGTTETNTDVRATTDRIVFSTGATSANTVSNLSVARDYLGGLSDGTDYGYFVGARSPSYQTLADRIVFSTGATSANTVSNLSSGRGYLAGVSDGSTYGYSLGGGTSALDYLATADRIVFSTGATSANTVSNLSVARGRSPAGVSDGLTYGYVAGGSTGAVVTTTDRIVFSTGATSANTVSNLSQARASLAGLANFAV